MSWGWPTANPRSTDEFGMRWNPVTGIYTLHRGIDLAASMGDPIRAAKAGWISWAGYNGGEGNSIHINHADGTKTKYFHNSSFVRDRDNVNDGELIAKAGTTGASTGPHCHFETHTSASTDSPVNPRGFMADRGAPFGTQPAGGNASPIDNGEDFLMGDDISNPVRKILEDISYNQISKLFRTDGDLRNSLKNLINEAIADDVENIKNAVRRDARSWRLYRKSSTGLQVAINWSTGVVLSYGSFQALLEDVTDQVVAVIREGNNPAGPIVPEPAAERSDAEWDRTLRRAAAIRKANRAAAAELDAPVK